MDPIVSCAERTLRESPHPALRMSELLSAMAGQLDRSLDTSRLRSLLDCHPDRFLVLDTWTCPWQVAEVLTGEHDVPRDSWVVAIAAPTDPPDGPAGVEATLRESVRWLAQSVDTRSAAELGRWHVLALGERAVRPALSKKAA